MDGTSWVMSPVSAASSVISLVAQTSRSTDGTMTREGSSDGPMSPRTPRLTEVWEMYIRAVKSQDQSATIVKKQSALLNILLKLCAYAMKDGTLPNFGEMRSVCNQLSKEFMSDILHITSRSQNDDVTQLQNYLLQGRGWTLLQVLHKKGVQNLSSSRDLANLLISLLPWCLEFPLRDSQHQNIDLSQDASLPSISACFQNILNLAGCQQAQAGNQSVPVSRWTTKSPRGSLERNSHASMETMSQRRRFSKHRPADSREESVDSDTDSFEEQEGKVRKLRRKFRYFSTQMQTERQAQTKGDSDSEDDDVGVLLKTLNIEEDQKTTGFHLCILILGILRELCLTDTNAAENEQFLSPGLLPGLLQSFVSFGAKQDSDNISDWEVQARKIIQMHLVRVVLISCGVTAGHQNGMNIFRGHRVIEQVFSASGLADSAEDTRFSVEGFTKQKFDLNLMSDCSVGLLICLSVIFEKLPFNPTFTKTALNLIEEFDDHKGFQMLEKCTLYSDWLKSRSPDLVLGCNWLEDEPIKVVGSFLTTLKVVRVNYIHSVKCMKRKHHKCVYSQYFDHHHDILGLPTGTRPDENQEHLTLSVRKLSQNSASSLTRQPSHTVVCLVSSCTQFLLDLLNKVIAKVTRLDLLKTIYASGICCCMSFNDIVSIFVKGMKKFSPAVRTFCADTLNKIILEHFSGRALTLTKDAIPISCLYCDENTSQCDGTSKYTHPDFGTSVDKPFDSGIDDSDLNTAEIKMNVLSKISKWRPVQLLKELLLSDNEELAVSTAKHLMVLAVKGNPYLKAQLFFSLYTHALNSMKLKECSEMSEKTHLSKSVQVHCLSALPFLLQANCVTRVFLSKKGIGKLCVLLEDAELRAPVLRVFEALVVLDETRFRESPANAQPECPCPYKGGLVIDAFINELSKRSFSDKSSTYFDDSWTSEKGTINRDCCVLSKFSLPVLVDLWETCAKLSLHSHVFVSQFKELQCFSKTEALLVETLDIIMSPDLIGQMKSHGSFEAEDSGMEGEATLEMDNEDQANFYKRVALLESLMAVIGAGNRDRDLDFCQLKVWQRVRERFVKPVRLETTRLKTLLDTILSAAMRQFVPLLEFSFNKNIALVYSDDGDIYDEDEVRVLLQSASDEDHAVGTEIEYDADTEETHIQDSDKDKRMRCLAKCRRPHKVYLSTTLSLLVEILVLLHGQGCWETVVSAMLHKLLQNVRIDINITKALCQQNVLYTLLGEPGFWECLITTDTNSTVQDTLLSLIEQLGQHKIESCDLQKILQLFQHSDLPLEKLVLILLSIVEKASVGCEVSVAFPARAIPCTADTGRLELEKSIPDCRSSTISPLLKTVTSIFMMTAPQPEIGDAVIVEQEVWKTCALKCNLRDSVNWPAFQTGVSLAMWACVEKGTYPRCNSTLPLYHLNIDDVDVFGAGGTCTSDEEPMQGCLHLASIGTREKMLEIWTEPYTGSLIFRLTSECSDVGLVVKETRLPEVISPDRWQHLVVSYIEELEGSTLAGKVSLVVDGWQSHCLVLDYPYSAVRSRQKSTPCPAYLLIGHTVSDPLTAQIGKWSLGQLMLFKGNAVSKESWFHLYTLGPNQRSILKCDSSLNTESYAPHLNKHVVMHSRIAYEALAGQVKPNMNELRQTLLFTFDPRKPTQMCEYLPLAKASSQAQQSPGSSNLLYTPDSLLTQQSRVVTPGCQGQLYSNYGTSLDKAVEETGGIAAILFLVAKVYERCPESMPLTDTELIQAEVLKVLFSVVHHSSRLHHEYLSIGGHALLCKVLTSSRSVPGQHTLKVLMDAATTESLFRQQQGSSDIVVKGKTDTIIRDVSIIDQLILDWQIWDACGPRVMELLFAGLEALVREEHPYQMYNIKQCMAINIVNRIFKIYQERIQEGVPALSVAVSQSVVSIIENMAGSPPDYHLIQEICHFLLLVHPAANTYINHSKSQFYFSLPWAQPASPLTQWKLGLGQGLASSTPVKVPFIPGKDSTSGPRRNLSGTFNTEHPVLKAGSKIVRPKPVRAAIPTDPNKKPVFEIGTGDLGASAQASQIQVGHRDSAESFDPKCTDGIELKTDSNIPDNEIQSNACSEASSSINSKQNEETGTSSPRRPDDEGQVPVEGEAETEEVIASGNWPLATHIPDNFESLYKRENSIDNAVTDLPCDIPQDLNMNTSATETDVDEESTVDSSVTGEASPSSQDLNLNFDEDNTEMVKQQEGLIAVCVGLLRLMSTLMKIMPDGLVEKTFKQSIINPQIFIVLAQNSSAEIREAVIQVLSSYLGRCNDKNLEVFIKLEGFQLLSAQLHQYPTHQSQMESATSVVLMRSYNTDDGLHPEEVIEDLTRVQQAAIPLMLSLLSNSTGDLALCHNTLQFASKLYDRSDVVATVMMEQGLLEVLCNMLVKVLRAGARNTDVEGMDESEILLADLLDFFKVIVIREFSASGNEHYQQFEDLIIVLQDLEAREIQTQGLDGRFVGTLKSLQYHVLVTVIDLVEKTSEEISQQSQFSLFSSSTPKPHTSRSLSYADWSAGGYSSQSSKRHLPSTVHNFPALSNTLGRLPKFRKKSSGYFVHQSDLPFLDTASLGSGSSGGDSDSSQDSYQSYRTVNLPVQKQTYLRHKSVDMSHGRLARSNSLLQTVFSHIGKRKKHATQPVSQNELIERVKKLVTVAVDTTIFSQRKAPELRRVIMLIDFPPQSNSMEQDFIKRVFNFAYRAFEATMPQEKSGSGRKNKNVIMWGAKDVLRVQLGRLLSYMLSDRQDLELRVFALSFMVGEQRGLELLKLLITTPDMGSDLGHHVYDLLTRCKHLLTSQQVEDGSRLINHLTSARCEVPSTREPASPALQERIAERKKMIDSRLESQKAVWLKRKENSLNRRYHHYDAFASKLSDNAMEVTQNVTQLQTYQRNTFITYIKQKKTDSIRVKKRWQEIVQSLTHERALWYDVKSYPQSWQLNPTEGPCRVRKRLQRGHLGILPKFLRKEFQYKLATETVDPPLIYLFEDDHHMSDSAALIYQLHKNKKIRYTITCRAVSPMGESKGELLIGEDSVFFVADEAITDANYTQVLLGNKDQLSMTWPFEDVLEVHKRWYELMDVAIEIFLTNGKTCLLAFKTTKDRDVLYQELLKLELPNRRNTINVMDALDSWENGKITNFEYLTELNKLAGRTFNDLMQYPVMPFVLRDYTSARIDLRDYTVYRDLSKPVSVQDAKNEKKFRTNYDILRTDYDRFGKEGMTGLRVAPYHYGSHYSNSGSVLHFLVRLPPFTKLFLGFQDQSFDIPDRTFHNLNTSWRLSSAESNTDVKELIPEFFFSHEFLTNSEGFEFGKRQNGEPVHNVTLPAWCGGNARLFTLIHRQALESDYVKNAICLWIDLVFGFKQQGEEAVKAVNVFHPATYFGLDVSSVRNSLDRKALQTMVRTYGQTPKQLFDVKHPLPKEEGNRTEYVRYDKESTQKVVGLKWGQYLGSPVCPEPVVTWEKQHDSPVACLVPLPGTPRMEGVVFGISEKSCLLVQYTQEKQKASSSDTTSDVMWAAILTWAHMDGLVRIIKDANKLPINCLYYNQSDEISCCVSVPDCSHLFFGGTSGVISVFKTRHNKAKESELQVFGHQTCLYGHTDCVNEMVVCKPYSVMVSGSQDTTCIIWDLNRLSYVRSVTGHTSAVKVIAVSNTLGDIASVSHHGLGSHLYLHTINAEYVTMVTCEDTIKCLTYSTAAEGVSINVLAGGLSSGVVRMWSSWDLSPVRDLCHAPILATPIISLTFTVDSQKLYVSSADGRVMLWDFAGQRKPQISRFKPYLFPAS